MRADALEREFFGAVDDSGAKARGLLLRDGALNSADQRCDFARLLLSLDARRPQIVSRPRTEVAEQLRASVDVDDEVLAAMQDHGIAQYPSAYFEEQTGQSLDDQALLIMQSLVDNPEVGRYLINAHWRVYRLEPCYGSFLLGDRPLIRIGGYSSDKCLWALPLTPNTVFVAANAATVAEKLDGASGHLLRQRINESTMKQIDHYVFMADESNLPLVTEHLSS